MSNDQREHIKPIQINVNESSSLFFSLVILTNTHSFYYLFQINAFVFYSKNVRSSSGVIITTINTNHGYVNASNVSRGSMYMCQ